MLTQSRVHGRRRWQRGRRSHGHTRCPTVHCDAPPVGRGSSCRPPVSRLQTTHRRAHGKCSAANVNVSIRTPSYFSHTHTHTHTHPFNGPLSRTTRVSQYQKGKTNLDYTKARHSDWQWHQLGHMQVCTSLQTDNHANTPPLIFLQAGCPSCRPTNSVKALKALRRRG